ncbi:hypothetical protein CF319_g6366 [Tilletia indica]|nr:hypothetical protein CF319_g6366 [Tilletia indica]
MKKHKRSKVQMIDMTIFSQVLLEVTSKDEDEYEDTLFENTITPIKAPLIHLVLAPLITPTMAPTRLLPVPSTASHQTSTSSLQKLSHQTSISSLRRQKFSMQFWAIDSTSNSIFALRQCWTRSYHMRNV